MEERVGERRRVYVQDFPLSSLLSSFVHHGERKTSTVLR